MLILDTHALYWWVNQTPGKLGQRQSDAIETAEYLAVSAMTCWEMAWLIEHGRLLFIKRNCLVSMEGFRNIRS